MSSIITTPFRRAAGLPLAVAALAALVGCGGSSTPPTQTTPTPPPPPTPTPTPTPLACSPTPPPLHGIHVKIHEGEGSFRKILDSRPQVVNVDGYCERVNGISGKFCFARNEGDPQAPACDSMAVGKALDTGRWGPTWYWDDKLCTAEGDTTPGCRNSPNNQFLVIAKGPGRYTACASPDVPVAGDRCGDITVK
ncbi:MAG TPA: hypothetical protein VGB87_18090 [Vicinamibacteria bacterium]